MKLELITEGQAAEALSVSRATLSRMRKKGEGPKYIRVSARIFYVSSEVRMWVLAKMREESGE